jgi:hypothetical protein
MNEPIVFEQHSIYSEKEDPKRKRIRKSIERFKHTIMDSKEQDISYFKLTATRDGF